MADETSQEEPSMEEILASIRRIISEGGEEEEKPDVARPSTEKYSALGAGRVSAEAQLADAAELTGHGGVLRGGLSGLACRYLGHEIYAAREPVRQCQTYRTV